MGKDKRLHPVISDDDVKIKLVKLHKELGSWNKVFRYLIKSRTTDEEQILEYLNKLQTLISTTSLDDKIQENLRIITSNCYRAFYIALTNPSACDIIKKTMITMNKELIQSEYEGNNPFDPLEVESNDS